MMVYFYCEIILKVSQTALFYTTGVLLTKIFQKIYLYQYLVRLFDSVYYKEIFFGLMTGGAETNSLNCQNKQISFIALFSISNFDLQQHTLVENLHSRFTIQQTQLS